MSVNNYTQIRDFIKLTFEDQDYYFIQIIKRRKENPDMQTGTHIIKCYFIDSIEKFDKKMSEIIDLCYHNNARAYINLNKRNYRKTALYMIKYLTDLVIAGQENGAIKAFELCSGQHAADKNKKWILDVDIKDKDIITQINHDISNINPIGPKVYMILPTKNGYHIITKPFDPREYSKIHPDHEIHKDNPTLLYIP